MTNRQNLEQAIAVQESLRGTIDDAILDATIHALRAQLAAELAAAPESRRAQATILFLDLAGHTGLIQGRDPEEIMEIVDRALERLAEPIARHGGRIVRYQGDGYKAVFGLPAAQENDPDNAVMAALDILTTAALIAAELEAERNLSGFQVRVGIDTGLVLIGGGTEAEDAVTGLPVNLAARLESAAEPGTILISHHTYQHIRGVFDFQPLEPIRAKGFMEVIPVYRVLRRKPRSFRTRRRGVEGVETRMVGREAELGILQEMFRQIIENNERRSAIVVGDAGLGKSRLLYEFENWVDLQPVNVQLYRGRAWLETQNLPYGLLRNVFVFRCGIHDDDSADVVRNKLVSAFQAIMGDDVEMTRQAHLVGHLIGYDFNSSPYVQSFSGDVKQLRSQAMFYLTQFFRAVSARGPVLFLFEDLHWADNSSLDTIAALVGTAAVRPAMILSAARPALYERHPDWLADRPEHRRIDLTALDPAASNQLVSEVLRRTDKIPNELRQLIITRSEGNPYYVEELVKVLIDGGAIVVGEDSWRVNPERLTSVRVPATLTGVLQARLEGLPAGERDVLQRASVVGRLFWDDAVKYVGDMAGDSAFDRLAPTLQRRELVYRREETAFEGVKEYVFKHALLRDVTYESVLKRLRRVYHRRAAEWLVRMAGERADEYADQIAAHYAAAGDDRAEAEWQGRAGRQAARRYAATEAIQALSRALELTPPGDFAARYDLLLQRWWVFHLRGDRALEAADLEALGQVAARMDDVGKQAQVAANQTRYLLSIGEYDQALVAGEEARVISEQAGDLHQQARVYQYCGNALMFLGNYEAARATLTRGLELARASGARRVQMETVRILGIVAEEQGDFDAQQRYFTDALQLAREAGDRWGERRALNSLGVAALTRGAYELASSYYQESLAIARAIGDRVGEGTVLGNMGVRANNLGDYARARELFTEALTIAREIDDRTGVNINLLNLAAIQTYMDEPAGALITYEQARRGVAETGDRPLAGYVLNGMGIALLKDGRVDEAQQALREARDLRLELGQIHLVAESRAWLAEALAAGGDLAAAVNEAGEALAFLERGQLEDSEDLLKVLLAIHRALAAAGDERARAVLNRAYEALQASAARLDDGSQQAYQENVPWNREIVALWAEHGGG
jgi:class 3 adenylate cyclase/tetratricopeptide (TPR) repeat protein